MWNGALWQLTECQLLCTELRRGSRGRHAADRHSSRVQDNLRTAKQSECSAALFIRHGGVPTCVVGRGGDEAHDTVASLLPPC